MTQYAREFAHCLDANGIHFSRSEKNDNHLIIPYSGDNFPSLHIVADFDDDGDPTVQFRCWELQNFKSNPAMGVVVCNDLNMKYRWIKFYLDDDRDIVATLDAVIDPDNCGSYCLLQLLRMVSVLDDAYPQIAKARWS
ncbi:MAG: YbjN domain-containing protein [Clostridia bacterium]|nr:YbjN domain-containing protein [Clostridia bacterium]